MIYTSFSPFVRILSKVKEKIFFCVTIADILYNYYSLIIAIKKKHGKIGALW